MRLVRFRLLKVLPAALLLVLGANAAAQAIEANASYVVSLGGTNIASAKFRFAEDGKSYNLALDANVSGVAQLVASGVARVDSNGAVSAEGLRSTSFDLTTRASGSQLNVRVEYQGGDAVSFIVDPPIVNNIDRVPLERKQLGGVNDFIASFLRKAKTFDRSLCDYRARIFTGIERFDLDFTYARDDEATSPRTGYQGPVVLCSVKYRPIAGHYTTSEITNSLAEEDRILIWYAPLKDTGYYLPYRVLLSTSAGDLSMVLTKLD